MKRAWPLLPLALAACAPTAAPPPARVAAPPPVPTVVPPTPLEGDWRDIPLTPGTWRYRQDGDATVAAYGPAGQPALFALRCERAKHQLRLERTGFAGPLTVRTSYGERVLGPLLAANDPALDQIAFSRGRFSVAAPGQPILFLPAWAEPSRVIEDCRG